MKCKNVSIVGVLVLLALSSFSQSNKVQSAWNALKFKELDKAKAAIDVAAEHPETKDDTKMWYYRGKIYFAISDDVDKFKTLDVDAPEKTFSSFLNCLKADTKKAYFEEVSKLLIASGIKLYYKGLEAADAKDYSKAIRYINYLPSAFEYDKEKAFARKNITPESVNFSSFKIYKSSGENAKAKESVQKLIDVNYKDPSIYLEMSKLLLEEKDTAKALSYIEKGRNLFEENTSLINAEMALYIAQKKVDVLLDKTAKAIEVSPDNEMLYFIRGSILDKKGDREKAEEAYKKSIELKPEYLEPNFNLGALYFNTGADYTKKANDLPLGQEKKAKELDDKASEAFAKSIPYLEKAHELSPNDNTVTQTLLKVYKRTGNDEKYNQLKESTTKK